MTEVLRIMNETTTPLAVSAVLFDSDGTLLDTLPDLHAAASAMLRDVAARLCPRRRRAATSGAAFPTWSAPARRFARRRRRLDSWHRSSRSTARAHYARENGRQVRPYPGVIDGLKALKAKAIPLGVITNKAQAFTLPLLEQMGLAHFDVVVSGDLLPKPKPDPMALIWACGRLNVSPAETLFIGDSINDFLAGRAAGCHVFLLPYGYNEGRDVHEPRLRCYSPDR